MEYSKQRKQNNEGTCVVSTSGCWTLTRRPLQLNNSMHTRYNCLIQKSEWLLLHHLIICLHSHTHSMITLSIRLKPYSKAPAVIESVFGNLFCAPTVVFMRYSMCLWLLFTFVTLGFQKECSIWLLSTDLIAHRKLVPFDTADQIVTGWFPSGQTTHYSLISTPQYNHTYIKPLTLTFTLTFTVYIDVHLFDGFRVLGDSVWGVGAAEHSANDSEDNAVSFVF